MNTIVAQLITDDGLGRRQRRHQPEPEEIAPLTYRRRPSELRLDHFRIDRHAVLPLQSDFIPLKRGGHSGRCVGRAEHLEQRQDGLWLVGEIAGDLPPDARYLSPEWRQRADGSSIIIDGAAVVERPAQIVMVPLVVVPGELSRCATRGLRTWQAEMIERARDATKHRTRGQGIDVYDHAYPDPWGGASDPASDPLTYRAAGTHPGGSRLIHNVNRPEDGLFIRPGRIISVR